MFFGENPQNHEPYSTRKLHPPGVALKSFNYKILSSIWPMHLKCRQQVSKG